ncbi:ANTAR domain-containing protein [Streptomyces venezuelae]|uniref:ANTAR domain-containing protein n=1 Tax=Streptomyces venezuelae TaxID=54571 RepID=UPI0034573AC4
MTVPEAAPSGPLWWDRRTQQRMEQYARAAAQQAWSVQKRQRAVEMRLRALSMRVFTQAARAAQPPAAVPPAPDRHGTPTERAVRAAVVTEQAKGVLAARFACTPEQALFLLHEHSRRTNRPIVVLTHQVVQHRGLAA